MSKKKGKFDLTRLVHDGFVKEGDVFHFVSNPKITFKVIKHPAGEYKIEADEVTTTVHVFAQKCLGQEPPNHATCWFANAKGETLYQVWQHHEESESEAA